MRTFTGVPVHEALRTVSGALPATILRGVGNATVLSATQELGRMGAEVAVRVLQSANVGPTGASNPRGLRGPRVLGALVGSLLGAGLLVSALAVDVLRLGGGSDVDPGMFLTGIFFATVIFVGIGIWLGGVVGRRRGRRMAH